MLKNIPAILNADVLYALRAMGHGDTLAIVDTNFPAESVARHCVIESPARVDGVGIGGVVDAVLQLFPLEAAARMEVMGEPDTIPPAQADALEAIARHAPDLDGVRGVERFQFYDEAKRAFAVIQTGERRFYGCVLFTKGVIAPDEA